MSSSAAASTERPATTIGFGPFEYDAFRRELKEEGILVRVGSRALDLLAVLLESPGALISRDELVSRVWPRTVVEETSVRVHMHGLRRALRDGRDGKTWIKNVPGRGYVFVGEVRRITPTGVAPAAPATDAASNPAGRDPRNRLPVRLTRPIGREQVISRIVELLDRERLVCIVGTGGVGKTTVALSAAERRATAWADGAFFVDLSRIAAPELVLVEVGQTCGLDVARSEALTSLADDLRDREALIVLDNCEHVIEAAAMLVDRLLRGCPKLRILATSRESLQVEAEQVLHLPSLAAPESTRAPDPDDLLAFPAIELFVERATAASDSFRLDQSNAGAVAQLCRVLDGVPLAIELAAARVASLSVQSMVSLLGTTLETLIRGRRCAPNRHRTLHAVLNWSYELLSPTEQQVLQGLSVFRGTFDLESAIAVTACDELPRERVIDSFLDLCAKSLVMPERVEDHRRHRLLYVTRLFAERALADSSGSRQVRHRHARLMLSRVVDAGRAVTDVFRYHWTPERVAMTADLRAAIHWTLVEDNELVLGMEITAESLRSYLDASLMDEYRGYVLLALEKAASAGIAGTPLESKLQVALSYAFGQNMDRPGQRRPTTASTLALASRLDSAADKIEALYGMATGAYGQGNYLEALTCCEEIRQLAKGGLEPLSIAICDRLSAISLHALGKHDDAERLAARVMHFESDDLQRRFQSEVPFGVSMRIQLARIGWLRGDFENAWAIANQAIFRDATVHAFARCQPLGMAAIPIAIWKGDLKTAACLNQELLDQALRSNLPFWRAFATVYGNIIDGQPVLPGTEHAILLEQTPLLMDIVGAVQPVLPSALLLERVRDGKVGWSAPEVLRVAALGAVDPADDASLARCVASLHRALAISTEQGALFWSLRVLVSLCEILPVGDPAQALVKDRLSALLEQVDDGSQMPDLARARELAHGVARR